MLNVLFQKEHRGDVLLGQLQVKAVVLRDQSRQLREIIRTRHGQDQESGLLILPCVVVTRSVLLRRVLAVRTIIATSIDEAAIQRIGTGVALAINNVERGGVRADANRVRLPPSRNQSGDKRLLSLKLTTETALVPPSVRYAVFSSGERATLLGLLPFGTDFPLPNMPTGALTLTSLTTVLEAVLTIARASALASAT